MITTVLIKKSGVPIPDEESVGIVEQLIEESEGVDCNIEISSDVKDERSFIMNIEIDESVDIDSFTDGFEKAFLESTGLDEDGVLITVEG